MNKDKWLTLAAGVAAVVAGAVLLRYGMPEGGATLMTLGGGLLGWVKKHWTDQ